MRSLPCVVEAAEDSATGTEAGASDADVTFDASAVTAPEEAAQTVTEPVADVERGPRKASLIGNFGQSLESSADRSLR